MEWKACNTISDYQDYVRDRLSNFGELTIVDYSDNSPSWKLYLNFNKRRYELSSLTDERVRPIVMQISAESDNSWTWD